MKKVSSSNQTTKKQTSPSRPLKENVQKREHAAPARSAGSNPSNPPKK